MTCCSDWYLPMRRLFVSRNIEFGTTDAGRSGYYYVDATVWMHAHWTQVTEPGWKILGVGGGGSGYLDGTTWQSGTYCTVVSPDGEDYSVILERLHCRTARVVKLALLNLPHGKPLALWRTNGQFDEAGYFQRDGQLLRVTAAGDLTLSLEAESIYSLTTLRTVTHGNFSVAVPKPASFPLPYVDSFDSVGNDTLPRYFADQGGSFAVIKEGSNGVMKQMAPKDPGPNGWVRNQDPISLIGDLNLTDVKVSVQGRWSTPPRRVSSTGAAWEESPPPLLLRPCEAGSKTQQWVRNKPFSGYIQNVETSNCLNQVGCGKNSDVIEYNCEAPGATQCTNLQWELTAQHQLRVNCTGQCVTKAGAGNSTHTADCVVPVPATQNWSLKSGTLRNDGLCLSSPRVQNYLAVCARISSFAAFDGTRANNGVCLRITFNADGSADSQPSWSILESTAVLAQGGGLLASATGWYSLELTLSGGVASAVIDGTKVGSARVVNATHGMVSLGSSYVDSAFDNFSVTHV